MRNRRAEEPAKSVRAGRDDEVAASKGSNGADCFGMRDERLEPDAGRACQRGHTSDLSASEQSDDVRFGDACCRRDIARRIHLGERVSVA